MLGFLRPEIPANIVEALDDRFCPAPEIDAFVRAQFLNENSTLFNPDHTHLAEATIGYLWTNVPKKRNGKMIAGSAEIPRAQGDRWAQSRAAIQLLEWFNVKVDFLITIYAPTAAILSDAGFCALVEHELYHCGHGTDEWGAPKFTSEGRPRFTIRGHDVEEFIGIVKRYGSRNAAGDTAALVEAALCPPILSDSDIEAACGTCGSYINRS